MNVFANLEINQRLCHSINILMMKIHRDIVEVGCWAEKKQAKWLQILWVTVAVRVALRFVSTATTRDTKNFPPQYPHHNPRGYRSTNPLPF
jgi:hypothetical protein